MNNWHVMYSIVRVKQVIKYFRPDRGDSRDIAVCHLAYYLATVKCVLSQRLFYQAERVRVL